MTYETTNLPLVIQIAQLRRGEEIEVCSLRVERLTVGYLVKDEEVCEKLAALTAHDATRIVLNRVACPHGVRLHPPEVELREIDGSQLRTIGEGQALVIGMIAGALGEFIA